MDNKKGLTLFFVIIAIISGIKIFQKYNVEIFSFNEPLESIIYIIYILGLVAAILGLIMNYKNRLRK